LAIPTGLFVVLCLPAVATACGNDSLRSELNSTNLPDCRAYEMVTPPYKEGYSLFPNSFAASGEKVILTTLANLAGASGTGESPLEGHVYMDTRTPSGWQLESLNAPLSEFVGQLPIAYEAESGETLWEQHTPAQSAFTRDLYVRSATGSYSLIGPIGIPLPGEETQEANYIYTFNENITRPVATTSDFNHIILRAFNPNDFWSFDKETVAGSSLYEYSGTDNSQPILVDVTGEKGSTHVVSQCGAKLGSGQAGSAFNALSADGEAVYFTAESEGSCGARGPKTVEVYVRLHGSTAAAETVDVSANDCTEACGGESDKNFEGASEDGKIAYFTSAQKLTNDAVDGTTSGSASENCSGTVPGEHGCNLYVYDFNERGPECQENHRCLKLVAKEEVLGVVGIAENGQRIYYIKRNSEELPELYVYDVASEESALVATLSYTGEEEFTLWSKEYRHPAEVSGEDGRYLLFASATPNLTADNSTSKNQLYEYDAVTGELVRVSKGENSYNNDGLGAAFGVNPESITNVSKILGNGEDFKSRTDRLNISLDGKTVVFRTFGKLSPLATAAERCGSVYEFRTTGSLSEGSVHLLSDGADVQPRQGGCGATFGGIDGNAEDVLFSTADPLLPSDVDGVQRDIYDARVEGGFPLPPNGASCTAACGVPAGTIAPALPAVTSTTQSPEAGSASGTKPASGPKKNTKSSRANKLKKALKACRRKPRSRRAACEKAAKRKYGSQAKRKAKTSQEGGR
jgi:hypothetical protein